MHDRIQQITSPDDFQRLCKSLLAAEYFDFQTIDDSGGDGGNDGYSADEKMLFQMFCPEKPAKATDATYTSKIIKDLDKAKQLVEISGYEIETWVFLTPQDLREPVHALLVKEAEARGFKGIAWSGVKLAEIFTRHPNLRSEFPNLIQVDIETQMQAQHAQLMSRLDTTDEVRKEYQTRIELGFQKRIDDARDELNAGKLESSKRSYLQILAELLPVKEEVDPHLLFRTYNNLGNCELKLHNDEKAAECFEQAFACAPTEPLAVVHNALAKSIRGKGEKALALLDAWLLGHPSDAHAIEVKASILEQLGRFDDLRAFLKVKGNAVMQHFYEGRAAMKRGELDRAVLAFEKVLTIEPDNVGALLLAVQNVMQGQKSAAHEMPETPYRAPRSVRLHFEKAVEWLLHAIRLLTNSEQRQDLHLCLTNLAGCYLPLGKYGEAIDAADQAIQLVPTDPTPYLNKGLALLKTHRFKESIHMLTKYVDLGGQEQGVEKHIAFCMLQDGNPRGAAEIVTPLLSTAPKLDMTIAFLAMEAYRRTLDKQKLDALLKTLEEDYPDDPEALQIRASHLHFLGLPGAEALFQRAVHNSTAPGDIVQSKAALANHLYQTKSFEQAAELLERFTDTEQSNPANRQYANCLYRLGHYKKLLRWMDTLHSAARVDPEIQEIEAYVHLSLENLDKSSQLFRTLFESHPDKLRFLLLYGTCRLRLGKGEDAKHAYDQVRNRLSSTEDLLALAGGYEAIGEHATALDVAYKAFRGAPDDPRAHMAFIAGFLWTEQASPGTIKPEYVPDFQKAIHEFNTRFPEEKAIQGFEVKDGDISEILKVVDRSAEFTDSAHKLYQESRAPLAAISRITGRRAFDVWAAFTAMPDTGIKMLFGSAEELATESGILAKDTPVAIVIDIYPLFLFAHLNMLNLLPSLFKKIYVHQSVADEVATSIDYRRPSVSKGVTTFGKVDGQYRVMKTTPEQEQESLDTLERLRAFLTDSNYCTLRGLTSEKPDGPELVNVLFGPTRGSSLLAEELGVPLLCDDRILRAALREQYGIASFSSIAVLDQAARKELISPEQRFDAQRELIDLNYDFVPVSVDLLVHFLQRVYFRPEAIADLVASLVKKGTSTDSLGCVLAGLLVRLMAEPSIEVGRKLGILKHILGEASEHHSLEGLRTAMMSRLQGTIDPVSFEKIAALVELLVEQVGKERKNGHI